VVKFDVTMVTSLEVQGFHFSFFGLYLSTVGSCPVGLQLDAGGIQVTHVLSSKLEEECKLVCEYWVDRVGQRFPSDLDEFEGCIQSFKKFERSKKSSSKATKNPVKVSTTKKKWGRGLCILVLIFFLLLFYFLT